MTRIKPPFMWLGAKSLIVNKLVPLLPPHDFYVEVFGGSGTILLAKPVAPFEVFNDIDSSIVNFYRVLRDPETFAELERLCNLTPHALEEWQDAHAHYVDEPDPVKRAWLWFVASNQAFGGTLHHGWARINTGTYSNPVADKIFTRAKDLGRVHNRIAMVQVDHLDWRACIKKYAADRTLFYLDPPYVPEERSDRGYDNEMCSYDHKRLVAYMLQLPGMYVLSGYRNPAIHDRLEEAGFVRHDFETRMNMSNTRTRTLGEQTVKPAQARTESVWLSPSAQEATTDGRSDRRRPLPGRGSGKAGDPDHRLAVPA